MLLLAAIATSMTVQPRIEATATARIERPSIAASELWERLPKERRREVPIRDQQGRELLLRLVENE